jgi:hypothetical protein
VTAWPGVTEGCWDTLAPEVRDRFEALTPATAGGPEPSVTGDGYDPATGTHVRFVLRVDGARIVSAHFRARGCPHTLVVASAVADALAGRVRAEIAVGDPEAWRVRFAVPVEKLGRLIAVEDALTASLQAWDRCTVQSTP